LKNSFAYLFPISQDAFCTFSSTHSPL